MTCLYSPNPRGYMFCLISSNLLWYFAAKKTVVRFFNRFWIFPLSEISQIHTGGRGLATKDQPKLLDVYREKPIRLTVRALVPAKDHPKVRTNECGLTVGRTRGSEREKCAARRGGGVWRRGRGGILAGPSRHRAGWPHVACVDLFARLRAVARFEATFLTGYASQLKSLCFASAFNPVEKLGQMFLVLVQLYIS